MSKHTPGPWILEGRSIYSLQHAGWRKGEEQFDNRFYTQVQAGREVPTDELDANARLIAAAPELLKACSALLSLCGEQGINDSAMTNAERVIGQALGEQGEEESR